MSRDASFIRLLRLAEEKKDKLVNEKLDIDKLYPLPFTVPEHNYALVGGIVSAGLCFILLFFLR